MWLTAGLEPGPLAVITQTSPAASVTEPAGPICTELARRYGPSLVLLEHHPAPQAGKDTETLDLVRAGADGSPHGLGVWPTAQENPRHAGLELWMAVQGTGSPTCSDGAIWALCSGISAFWAPVLLARTVPSRIPFYLGQAGRLRPVVIQLPHVAHQPKHEFEAAFGAGPTVTLGRPGQAG